MTVVIAILVTTGLVTLIYVSIKSHLTSVRFERFSIDQNDNTRLRRLDRWFDGRNDGAACDGRPIEAPLATWGRREHHHLLFANDVPWKYPRPLRLRSALLPADMLAAGASANQGNLESPSPS